MTSDLTILDGGMGRELKRRGAPFRQPEWSALALWESPRQVVEAHTSFLDAGADVIATNSYAVVPYHIGKEKFAGEGADLIALSGRLAREAANATFSAALVAGSLPPICGSYRPGHFDEAKATSALKIFGKALDPYCDLWLAETQSSIAEVKTVVDLFGSEPKPLWISVTLEDAKTNSTPQLRSGEPLEQLLSSGLLDQVDALLFNCSQPEVMLGAITLTKQVARKDLRIGAYANAFPPIIADENEANSDVLDIREDLTPARYREFAKTWQQVGATIIGGCCGVGPEHIKEVAKLRSIG